MSTTEAFVKLVVQVPCLNEEATLPAVLRSIPREVDGIDDVVIVVIDDGSADRTVEVALEHGADHVLRHTSNLGLARSFRDGVDFALSIGADVVVNTDGDNQYPSERIGDLVAPIVRGEADIVIGDRQTAQIEHFSPFKKQMQRFGSRVVNRAAQTGLPDAASGFRAYSRSSLLRLNIVTDFSYTMETIIQAGNRRMRIASIQIDTNPKTRESRLFSNIWQHMFKSGIAIVRSYLMFRPYGLLTTLATVFGLLGAIPFIRFGILFFLEDDGGHIQSLIFGSSMLVASFVSLALLVIADLQRTNRILLEETLERTKQIQYPADPTSAGPLTSPPGARAAAVEVLSRREQAAGPERAGRPSSADPGSRDVQAT